MEIKNKKFLILGKGKTGTSTGEFIKRHGGEAVIVDEAKDGPFIDIDPSVYDLVVQSPGISRQHPFLLKCDEMGILVTNEIELAYKMTEKPIVGVTGTNGKTTIVNLIDHIMNNCGKKSSLVGNVGNPFIAALDKENEVFVLELSSYQLETIDQFRPEIGIISNLTPDHLERHKTMENYLKIKSNIFRNMTDEDCLILNHDNEYLRTLDTDRKNTYYYSRTDKVRGIFVKNNNIVLNLDGMKSEVLMAADRLKIIGGHNLENAMAGILAAILFGCPKECVAAAASNFGGVEHRLEFIKEIDGVAYYNDSKATNPEAAITAIEAFKNKNLFLILGGSPKEVSYHDLDKAIMDNNVFAVIQGGTREEIAEYLVESGYERMIILSTLKEAVEYVKENAKPGDIVVLSPACASFDQFDNFEHRGVVFKEYVREE